MKRIATVLFLLVFAGTLLAQTVTPIASIQDTIGTDTSDSPLLGETVTVEAIVTAESWAFGNSYYFIQDAEAAWSGIKVYDPDRGNAYGDKIRITGTVDEYSGVTEIVDITSYEKIDSNQVVAPILVNTGDIGTGGTMAEMYEGVLVKVENLTITNPDANYGQWLVSDGSGDVMIDDAADYYFDPSAYDEVASIVGVLEYSYGDHKILPRLAYDIEEAGPYTRFQRFQQVRYSDLLETVEDAESDFSYMYEDTVTVTGVVTMPTGLSYAGDGIKFIFADPNGGPWSAVLSYHPDSTAYPVLYEGDVIELTGWIGEYSTDVSNMTELWITSPINVLDWGQPLPPVDTVSTGDLRLPVTAEQWGNVMVAVKDAVVTSFEPSYELFEIDDGTGGLLVDDDSDSIATYFDTNPTPPPGTLFESMKGWIYHHYGSYVDSSAYKIEPLYIGDMVMGSGPPQLVDVSRTPGVPMSTDAVVISVDVTTNGTIDAATILYTVDGGAEQEAAMSASKGDIYTGTIPAQANGSWVEYYIQVTDTEDQSATMPSNIANKKYGYLIKDEGLTIADIQESPWTIADSPFNECNVSVTGIVTGDTAMVNTYGIYSIQNGTGPNSGIFLFGVDQMLLRGDEVQVFGTVEEYNADYHYKWDNNTMILVDSLVVLSHGNAEPAAVELTTAELPATAIEAEPYEAVKVKVSDVQVTAINQYDWSVDDGSGPCLIDDDASNMDDWFNGLTVGTAVSEIQGIFTFSFGTYKIETRDMDDVGTTTGIDDDPITYPRKYALEQNFPNPFNPETRVYFEIPQNEKVTIMIYNLLGFQVRTLTNQVYTPGKHVLNWDGLNNDGLPVATGTYILRMKAGNFIDSKKMMLIR